MAASNVPPARIRLVTLADAPRLIEIYSHYVLKTSVTFEDETPTVSDFEDRIRKVTEFFPYFVLEEIDTSNIIGYAYVGFYHSLAPYRWDGETTIYVRDECRGRGYGPFLYGVLLQAVKDQGMLELWGLLDYKNYPSIKLQERFGFKTRGVFEKVGYKFGEWRDVIYVSLRFGPKPNPPSEPVPFSTLDVAKYLKTYP
jgi:phosphinothricin acetyltransferase